jgi:hypothetical protein
MAALSPTESLFLLKPNRTPARETVKVTLLSLLAQGIVRLEEQVTKRFIGSLCAPDPAPAIGAARACGLAARPGARGAGRHRLDARPSTCERN